jgi:hypothetical protein
LQPIQTYKTTAASFPWKDKFCDAQGINGINFKIYAVMGTHRLDLSTWASGVYIVNITSKQGTKHLKVIKQ